MKKAVFIAGTDTGVGKTMVSGLLGRLLCERKRDVITQKWVQTGCENFAKDAARHMKLMDKDKREVSKYSPLISPYIFKFPASPHLSAEMEERNINSNIIRRSFLSLYDKFDFVIVEGSGGVLTPISRNKLMIDIVASLKLPVLIVAANKLGAINHTLLTIEAVKKRKINIAGIIFNNVSLHADREILADNPKVVKSLSGQEILGILPWEKDSDLLYEKFMPIGKKIINLLGMA